LTEIELEFRRIKERMFATSQASEAMAQAREAVLNTEKKLKGQEEQVIQQIETTRRNLDIAQRRQATAANEYALVPYDGTSGTMRRPIYIECTATGYRFIPEDLYIGPELLDGFSEAYNPLLTGTQALMRYWKSRRKASGGSEPEPYVLLIVRPSGALSYYLARKLLTPLGANFGYELVDEDWKLSSRDADPQARAALTNAIEITVEARGKVRDSMGGKGGEDSFVFNNRRFPRGAGFPEELVTNPDGGGGDEGGSFAERAGNRSRGAGTGTGTGSGGSYAGSGRERARAALGGGNADGHAGGPGGLGNGADGTGVARGGYGGSSSGGNPGSGGTARQRAVAGNISGRPGGIGNQAGGDGAGFEGELGDGSGPGFEGSRDGGGGVPGGGMNSEGGTGSGDGSGTGRPRRGGRPGGARPAAISGNSANELEDEGEGPGGDGDASTRTSRFARNGTRGGRGSTGGLGSGTPGGDGGEVPPLEPLPDQMSPSHGNTPRVRSNDSGGTPGRLRNLEPEREPPMESPPEDLTPHPRAFGQSSGDRPWLPEDAPAVGGRGGTSGDRGSRFAGPRGGGGGGGGSDPQRGGRRQWGNGRGRAGIGLEKQLEIHAYADRLAIGPGEATVGVGRGEKNDELTNQVLGGIERTAQTWGAPPSNFYWIPAVKWVVHPGGNQYYERLRGPLEKWGINSTVEYNVSESAAGQQGGPRR
jgi:hypothetical protein